MPHNEAVESPVGPDLPPPPNHPEPDRDTGDPPFAHRATEDIDRAIVRLARRINADGYQMLVLIREFDERRGWLKCGLSSCADWLHWRCDLSLSAAREQVRVAHALAALPLIAAELASGRLSYSKARALTRIADTRNEQALLEMSKNMTAAHVEQHCRQRRNARAKSKHDAASAHEQRSLRTWRDEHRGVVTITIELPMAEGLLFERAIDKASADQGGSGALPDASAPWAALQADAAVAMARAYLQATDAGETAGTPSGSTADHYQVMVHVDHDALTGQEGRSQMPIDTVRRLCCDGRIVPVVEKEDGEPLSVGRRRRVVTTSIRRALWSRDRRCVFPGCTHSRFVDAHHLRHWADGGRTSLDNLVLLCTSHHRLVHEGGYGVERDPQRVLVFRRPDGRVIPACGYRVEDRAGPDDASAEVWSGAPSGDAPRDDGPDVQHAREPSATYRSRTVEEDDAQGNRRQYLQPRYSPRRPRRNNPSTRTDPCPLPIRSRSPSRS